MFSQPTLTTTFLRREINNPRHFEEVYKVPTFLFLIPKGLKCTPYHTKGYKQDTWYMIEK
jgi:hypothetical protein